ASECSARGAVASIVVSRASRGEAPRVSTTTAMLHGRAIFQAFSMRVLLPSQEQARCQIRGAGPAGVSEVDTHSPPPGPGRESATRAAGNALTNDGGETCWP